LDGSICPLPEEGYVTSRIFDAVDAAMHSEGGPKGQVRARQEVS